MSLRILALLALVLAPAWADESLDEALKTLLGKVARYVEPGPGVKVSVRNASSLGNADLNKAQRAFERALHRRAAKANLPSPPVTEIRLTLAEDVREAVLIAETLQEGRRHVEVARYQPETAPRRSLPPLERRLLWEQAEPILDVLPLDGKLLVLDRSGLSVQEKRESGWVRTGVVKIDAPPVRDPRGRIVAEGTSLSVYLPGATCHGRFEPALELTCTDQPESLTLASEAVHFVTGRNTLDSAGWNGYYSIARREDGNRVRYLVAEIDGRTRLYDTNHQPLGVVEGLSGDWIGVCGDRLFGARSAERSGAVAVALYAVPERKAIAITESAEFLSAVTALWPAPGGAIAIVRDSGNGNYAAYGFHFDCPR